jgi:hypothetical protein
LAYKGVTFNNLRKALYYIYYGADYPELEAYEYIIPMQNNFFNPIEIDGFNTYMQYFIERDEPLTQDTFGYNTNYTHKVAHCTVRFVGKEAEEWAKMLHHLTKQGEVKEIFFAVCQADRLEGMGDIVPVNINFAGKNAVIAFDIDFKLQYVESVDLNFAPLARVSIAKGTVV